MTFKLLKEKKSQCHGTGEVEDVIFLFQNLIGYSIIPHVKEISASLGLFLFLGKPQKKSDNKSGFRQRKEKAQRSLCGAS